MDFVSTFKFLINNFNRQNIRFAVIGGMALQFSGITRTTLDIDFLIASEDASKVKDIMLKKSYNIIHESEDVLNFVNEKLDLGRVDFLLAHRKYSIAMLKRAEEKEIFGGKLKIRMLKIEDLIGLKVQSSSNDPRRLHQDMADIESLIRHRYPDLDLDILREYFGLFDRAGELDKILNKIKNAK